MKKDAELRQGSKSSVSIPAYKTLENPPVCVCADKFETAPFEVMLKVCAFLIFHPTKKLPPGRCESTRAGIKKTQNKTKQKKTKSSLMCCQDVLAGRVQLHLQPQQQQLRLNLYTRHGRIIPTLFSLNSCCSPLLSVCVLPHRASPDRVFKPFETSAING